MFPKFVITLNHTDSHAPGEGLDSTLRTGVDGVLGHTLGLASDGSHKDDPAANRHPLVRLLGDEELSTGVDLHDTIVFRLVDVLEVTERNDTGVGAADVKFSKVLDDLVHKVLSFFDVGDIGLDCNGLGTSVHALDLLDNFLGGFLRVGIVDGNTGTTAGELEGHLLANATTW
jgi:hypothetical protein